MENTNPTLEIKGKFTVVYPSGDHRTLQFKTRQTGSLAGKCIVSYREGAGYKGFAFFEGPDDLRFWRKFREANEPVRLTRIQKAVATVVSNPEKHGQLYALESGRCWRCDLELTDPESILRGIGPTCFKKMQRAA